MIEAVNSVLQTAPFVRGNSDQTSNAESLAANPDRVQRAAPRAPYISPYVFVDVNFDRAVLQLRNGETGDVVDQFPSEQQLEAQARQQAARDAAREAAAAEVAAPQSQSQSAQAFVQQTAPNNGGVEAFAASNGNGGGVVTPQQQAAFAAAAQSGSDGSSGGVTVLA